MDAPIQDVGLAIAIALLIGLELLVPSFREGLFGGPRARRLRNWAFLTAAIFSALMVRLLGEVLRARMAPWVHFPSHPVLNFAGCFLIAELLGWSLHYVKHRHGWLWRFHVQHHREPAYDLWLVTHTHALEVVVSGALMAVVLVGLGFSPTSLELYFACYTLLKSYQHSGHAFSLGPLDKVLVSPAYHRLHHAVGAQVNFGISLTLFDLIFRTARWPVAGEELVYGEPTEPYGFVAEMSYFLEPMSPAAPVPVPAPRNQSLTTANAGLPRSV
ncbi:MAG: sterol desaturase family protein [Deltaproteobacteria bacterium]|nr:sterol desaturase family protein [Deltaproteobacteria bacterium]